MLHPWHDIPIGDQAPDRINTVIEVPRRSTVKYELDKKLGIIRISHVLYPPVPYPGNYGFIPQTLDEDDDPLDMMLIMRDPVSPMTLCQARPIGVVNMTDEDENDDKVLCVLIDDPIYDSYESFEALPEYERQELQWFFEEYQRLMHDEVKVKQIGDADAARTVVERCMKLYQEKHGNTSA